MSQIFTCFYKITKIVRALWLAGRSVCMRVCKHGCGVKMFCFSRANHASTNLKKFSSSKLDKFTTFTYSLVDSTSSRVCMTVSNSPNPSRVYIRLYKHGKRFLLVKCKTKALRIKHYLMWRRTSSVLPVFSTSSAKRFLGKGGSAGGFVQWCLDFFCVSRYNNYNYIQRFIKVNQPFHHVSKH